MAVYHEMANAHCNYIVQNINDARILQKQATVSLKWCNCINTGNPITAILTSYSEICLQRPPVQ